LVAKRCHPVQRWRRAWGGAAGADLLRLTRPPIPYLKFQVRFETTPGGRDGVVGSPGPKARWNMVQTRLRARDP
jgi:hypothetical protein